MPMLMLIYVNKEYKMINFRILDIVLFLIITYCVYYCMSANTVVAYTLLIIYLVFKKIFDNKHIFNAKNYFIFFLAIFFGIVIFRIQNIFSWLIVDILNKDLTFTHRTTIWDRTIGLIKKHWILGYGKESTQIVAYKLGKLTFTHAHNTLLDVTYKYGIIGLTSFISMIIATVKQLTKQKKINITKFFSFILLCSLIMMNFEARQEKVGLYIILVLCYHIDSIIKNNKKN